MNNFCMAEGITFRYFEKSDRNILDNVSLSFNEGEVSVILGSSGCGKSTFAAVLCGLYPENGGFLADGQITIAGQSMKDLSYRERSLFISEMFQNPDLQFCMENLRDELRFCLENQCVPREEMDERINTFAEHYHVTELLDRPFYQLSGGEKQKAALSCILLINPKVMVLDEPFANLDHVSREHFMELLTQKVREDHTTIIAIDHQASNWFSVANRYILLGEHGQVLRENIPADALRLERSFLTEHGLIDPFEETVKRHSKTADDFTEEVLTLKNVQVFHSKKENPVLSDVSASAKKGQMIACLGSSGGGKTSLFLTLLGQKHYAGSILLNGQELKRLEKRELFSKIGIVFQNPGNQFITSSVLDEVTKSLEIWHKADAASLEATAREMLEQYNLRSYARYSPYMLSQGQQRRLGVLSMLAGGQQILLLDEPTYGQDGRTTKAIMDQMRERADHGLTVIFSTHDETLASRYADKIWKVTGGSLYEEN